MKYVNNTNEFLYTFAASFIWYRFNKEDVKDSKTTNLFELNERGKIIGDLK